MLGVLFATAAFTALTAPKAMPTDFYADIHAVRSGLTYSGHVQVDTTGRRYSEYLGGIEQTTILLQPGGHTVVYNYVVIPTQPNPTCTCAVKASTTLADPWVIYANARSNGTTCKGAVSGKSGILYSADNLGYVGEPNLVQLCQATDGTPIYTAHLQEVMEYTSFTPKRIVDFNMTALATFLPACSAGCSHQ